MAQVNPQLTTIIELMVNQAAAAHEDALLIASKLDEQVALANDILLQSTLTASYTGDIRNDMIGIHEKLDLEIGLQTQIRDLLEAFKLAYETGAANLDADFTSLLDFLDVMNTNAAANTLLLRDAICGDCPPPVDPGEDFACWVYQNTSPGPDSDQGLPFNSGPGYGPFNAGEGFSIHWRGNEYLADTRIYVYQIVPDSDRVLLATMDSAGDFYAAVWNGDPIAVSASAWPEFPKNLYSVWVCPDGVEPPP